MKVVQAADVRLRRRPAYQWLRRSTLAASLALVIALPLLHLRAIAHESSGRGGSGPWMQLVEALPLPLAAPPIVGAPTAIEVGPFELLDPVFALSVCAASGPSAALASSSALALILVLVLGRFFCSWLCPYVPILAVSNAVRALLARIGLAPRDVPLPRHTSRVVLGVVLIASAITGSQIIPLVYPPALVGREVFRAVFFGGLGAGAIVLGLAFAFDTFVSRAGFCRYVCPGGATFGMLGLLSPIRVERAAPDCTDCTVCDQVCNMLQRPMTDQVDSECDRCGKCVSACPTGALSLRFGLPPIFETLRRRRRGRR